MTVRRLIALAMVAVEALLAGYCLGQWFFAAIATVAATIGAMRFWHLPDSRARDYRLTVLLFVLVLINWQLFGKRDPVTSAALMDGLGAALVQFFITAQVYELYVRRERGISPLFVLYGAIVITCSGDVIRTGRWQSVLNAYYFGFALVFVVLVVLFWLTGREARSSTVKTRRPWVLSATTLIVSLAFGATVSFALKTNQHQLDTWFANLVTPRVSAGSVGFPDRAFLHSIGNVKKNDANSVALRVVSDRTPGYLKGLAYDVYSDARWARSVTPEAVEPQSDSGGESMPGMRVFALRPDAQASGNPMKVWPEVDTTGAFFVTLESVRLHAPFDTVMVDAIGNVASPGNTARSPYGIETSTVPLPLEPLTEEERERYLFVPSNLDPAIRQLAGALFTDSVTLDEKVAAVLQYFHDNYQYELGITVPSDVDPLAYFLLEKPPAHCEYFATGAAVLLRLGGVPCRYVTGFVTVEQNSIGGYWVARNRDAHAWVEAYDESRGWFIVEATVAEGVPSEDATAGPSRLGEMWDYAKFLVREIVSTYVVGGIKGLGRWLGDALLRLGMSLLAPVPATLMALVVTAFTIWRFRRKGTVVTKQTKPPYRVELRKLLAEMDRLVRQHGLDRASSETLLRFAARLSQELPDPELAAMVGQWYRTYACLRFGAPPSPQQIEELRQTLHGRMPVR